MGNKTKSIKSAKSKSNKSHSRSAFKPFMTKTSSKAFKDALERQKDFPKVECTKELAIAPEPLKITNEGTSSKTYILTPGENYALFATHLKDPETSSQLYSVVGASGGELFLTRAELETYFNLVPVLDQWNDMPWATPRFSMKDVKPTAPNPD